MKKFLVLSLFAALLIAWSCNRSSTVDEAEEKATGSSKLSDQQVAELSTGFQLLETNCFSCHSPNARQENRVAPPMMAIKKHYAPQGVSREDFTKQLIAFINNPKAENARLENAVEKFGVMPKMDFNQPQLEAIAAYIYQAEFEKPGWHQNNYAREKKRHMQASRHESYLEQGQNLAMQTKSVLGKNLLAALKEKGPEGALEFCSTKAIPLTDSMSLALNASIKRVSDKNRNPDNAAAPHELAYIEQARSQLLATGKAEPMMRKINDRMVGYYPITTNQMCLQCHGDKQRDISVKTQESLNQLYPNDLATGYEVDQLRGIWVVEMEKRDGVKN